MKSTTRLLLSLAAGLVLLGGGAALYLRHRLRADVDYSRLTSVEVPREFQDPKLLAKAWNLPVATIYRREGFEYQRNPTFSGPASVVDVIRSIGDDADQSTILDGTPIQTEAGLLPTEMTLDELADVLRQKSDRHVDVLRDLDDVAFRSQMAHSNEPTRRYIVNFDKGRIFPKAGAHFSPIAGYLADEDLVLVIDVNDRYKPWLVKTDRLLAAVDTEDPETGQKRGLLLLDNR